VFAAPPSDPAARTASGCGGPRTATFRPDRFPLIAAAEFHMEQGFGGTFRKGVYVRSATPVFRGTSSTRADSLPFHRETAYLLALLIGIVAGLRTMTAPAAVSWAAHLGWLRLDNTWLAFLGYASTPWILTLLAAGELVTDQLPSTPRRTVPVQLGARIRGGGSVGSGVRGGGRIAAVRSGCGHCWRSDRRPRRRHRSGAACRGLRQRPSAGLIEDAVAVLAALLIVTVVL